MTEKDSRSLSTYLYDYVMVKSYADVYYGAHWVDFEIYTETHEHYNISLNTDNRNVRFRTFDVVLFMFLKLQLNLKIMLSR